MTDVIEGGRAETWGALHPRFVASHPMAGTAESGVEAGSITCSGGVPVAPCPSTDSISPWWKRLPARWAVTGWWRKLRPRPGRGLDFPCAGAGQCGVAAGGGIGADPLCWRWPDNWPPAASPIQPVLRWQSPVGYGDARNTAAVLRGLAAYRWSLEQLEEAILESNWEQLESVLNHTKALRPEFL